MSLRLRMAGVVMSTKLPHETEERGGRERRMREDFREREKRKMERRRARGEP